MAYRNLEVELEQLLIEALESNASDLHLIPGYAPVLRIDSKLSPLSDKELLTGEVVSQIAQLMMGEERWQTFLKEKDIDFSYALQARRFRVNTYYQEDNIAIAIRVILEQIQTLEELNLPTSLYDMVQHRQGLILVVGPTGHGKSTAMAALIEHINEHRTEHIITIEDPIEFIFKPKQSIIQQREVGSDTLSFEKAIRATLREDANVVMIGEMRDRESIAAAVTVAQTGHLVITTLHTNDAAQTIDRIINMYPSHQQDQIRTQLAALLVGVVSLRLINKVGGGRVPAVEILKTNNAIRNLIREGRTHEIINTLHTGQQEGMVSLDQYLADLVNQNQISFEEAKNYINYEEIFRSRLSKKFNA